MNVTGDKGSGRPRWRPEGFARFMEAAATAIDQRVAAQLCAPTSISLDLNLSITHT
jgi:hypothetical protein